MAEYDSYYPDTPESKVNPAAPVTALTTPKSSTTQFETASGNSTEKAGATTADSVFYLSYRVFLEGIEVPCAGIQIEYGIQGIPTCTVTLPASNLLRDLTCTTKIAVFFLDLVPDSTGEYKWRLLFDGEFMGYGYGVETTGASMSLTFMHNAAHMHSMQLMVMDMTEFWIGGGNQYSAGDSTLVSPQGWNRPEKTILRGLLNKDVASNYKTMADICYTLVRAVIADVKGTASGKYFKTKFGDTTSNGLGGYKLLRRFYGISSEAAKMDIPDSEAVDQDTSGGGSNGSSIGSSKMNSDQPKVGEQPAAPKDNSYNAAKSAETMSRANKLVSKELEPDGFGTEGCARATNYMLTGDKSYPYSEAADVMATRVKDTGSIFTDASNLKEGDIVFYQNTYGSWEKGTVTHVGIYAGKDASGVDQIIHQGTSEAGVTKKAMNYANIAYYGRV